MLDFLALAILTLCSVAHSADRPTVAVVGVHQPGTGRDAQDEAIRALVRVIDEAKDFDALDASDVALRILGREQVVVEEGLLEGAVEKLNAGKGLYHHASPDAALLTLQTAAGEFMRAMPATNTVSGLWETWVYIGTCNLQSERPNRATARLAFQNAAALFPQRPLNSALFPPNVVEAYEQERAFLSQFPVSLEVKTDGPATVWVDGVKRGRAPVKVEGLLPGDHYVVARGDGTLGYDIVSTQVPDLDDAPETGIRPPTLVDARVSMRLPILGQASDSVLGRSQQTASLYMALGKRAFDVDYVLLAGVDDKKLYLQLLDARTESLSETLELPYTDRADDEITEAVPQLLAMVGPRDFLIRTSGTAAPLDVGANSRLAQMLLLPQESPIPKQGNRNRKKKRGLAAAVIGAVVVSAAAAGSFVYVATQN